MYGIVYVFGLFLVEGGLAFNGMVTSCPGQLPYLPSPNSGNDPRNATLLLPIVLSLAFDTMTLALWQGWFISQEKSFRTNFNRYK
jgi:hypothetical protein